MKRESKKKQVESRLYCLCIHYDLKKGKDKDWDWYGQNLVIDTDRVLSRLTNDIKYLRDVLAPGKARSGRRWEGFAFVFLDPGWTALMKGGDQWVTGASLGGDLRYAQEEIERGIDRRVRAPRRCRIITAARLIDLAALLEAQAGRTQSGGGPNQIFKLLGGTTSSLKYDAPKVFEAIVRIANIGRHAPIFRFDDDVIFYGQRVQDATPNKRNTIAKGTRANILRLCERYIELCEDPRVHYFVYSGSYEQPANPSEKGQAPKQTTRRSSVLALCNGFATRVVQLACVPKGEEPQPMKEPDPMKEAKLLFDKTTLFLQTLFKLGANPFRQVISGAGLCLCDSAILDLPPFANMRLNVMWIDDHLKYALHDELGHFGIHRRLHHRARVSNCHFKQLRHDGRPTYKDVKWHLENYMLRLTLGCVADAWLRQVANVKRSNKDLKRKEYKELVKNVPGIYAEEFFDVLPRLWQSEQAKLRFKEKLWGLAQERLRDLVKEWGDGDYRGTFLDLFVKGSDHEEYGTFKEYFPAVFKDGMKVAVEAMPKRYKDAKRKVSVRDESSLSLESAVKILVDDFVDYFELWRMWPRFVQSVRLLLNRHAQVEERDLDWMFPE
jgi:hypothetical protein